MEDNLFEIYTQVTEPNFTILMEDSLTISKSAIGWILRLVYQIKLFCVSILGTILDIAYV